MQRDVTDALAMYEDELEALRDLVRTLGGNKVLGHTLRPDLKPDIAGGWLKDCLNPERREKLELSQVTALLRMGREAGYHGPVRYLLGEAGYEVKPIQPEDEKEALQRAVVARVDELRHLVDRLDRHAKPSGLATVFGRQRADRD